MKCRQILMVLALFLLVILNFTNAFGAAGDTLYVETFVEEFQNWATPHEQTFIFPDSTLSFSQVTMYYTLGCPSAPGDCDPWDRYGTLKAIFGETQYELARIITPYDITGGSYPGECTWVIDATPYQSILRGEVLLHSYIESWIGGNRGWLVTVTFEFIEGHAEMTPYHVENLWQDGWMALGDPEDPIADYLPPLTVFIDAEADSVVFRSTFTGHGQGNTQNAAEFSMLEHAIIVNEQTTSHLLWRSDCEHNPCSPQGGTWQYDRAGWCPGADVIPWDVDITDMVTPGQEAVLDYEIEPFENFCRPSNPDCQPGVTCPDCNYNNTGHTPPGYIVQNQLIFFDQAPVGSLQGFVHNEAGEPLTGADIVTGGHNRYIAMTDENGEFSIPVVVAGEYWVSGLIFAYDETVVENITVTGGETANVDITLYPSPTGSISGYVYNGYAAGDAPVADAEITIVDTPLPILPTDADGLYQLNQLPAGVYEVLVEHPAYLSHTTTVTIAEGITSHINFHLMPVASFEFSDDGFVGDGEWEWGIPTESGGPATAFHGDYCWGTDLDDAYDDLDEVTYMALTTPEYQLNAENGPYEFSFEYWCDWQQYVDGGIIEISTDSGTTWAKMTPIGGYPFHLVVSFDYEPGYSGASNGWVHSVFDLTEYAGQTVMFKFLMACNPIDPHLGWFIDHVLVQGVQDVDFVGLEENPPEISVFNDYFLYQNHPNPFNPFTQIEFRLPKSEPVSLAIFDVTGRLVKKLCDQRNFAAGRHALTWDSTDQSGHEVSSGVYVYRLQTQGKSLSKQMILIK